MKNFLAAQQTENFKLQKQVTQLLKEKLDLESEIELAEQKVQDLEKQVAGVQEPHPLDN